MSNSQGTPVGAPQTVQSVLPVIEEDEGLDELEYDHNGRTLVEAEDEEGLCDAGVTTDQEAVSALTEMAQGAFARLTGDDDDGSVVGQEIARYAGGGVAGVTVRMDAAWGDGQIPERDSPHAVEFETMGPNDASGEPSWLQTLVLDPAYVGPTLASADWGTTPESRQAGLAALSRTAYAIWNCGSDDLTEAFSSYLNLAEDRSDGFSDATAVWQALGYTENPNGLDLSNWETDPLKRLQRALESAELPWPPAR